MKLCPRNAKGQCLAHGAGRNGQEGKNANAVLLRVSHPAKHCPELALHQPGFCLQAYFRTVRRGDAPGERRGGSGGCRQPCSTMQGFPPPPTVPSCLGQTRSIFSQSHPRIESWKSDVVLSLSCRFCYCHGLASRTSPFNCAPNSSIEPLPERLVVVMRSTRSAMDGSEVGCV